MTPDIHVVQNQINRGLKWPMVPMQSIQGVAPELVPGTHVVAHAMSNGRCRMHTRDARHTDSFFVRACLFLRR